MTAASPVGAISVGDELPVLELPVTATSIVAGAIASRDFMPAHHDAAFAKAQGAPDIFMNIHTTNGYIARFATDWAGPEAMLRSIRIRLGVPVTPGQRLRFTGRVVGVREQESERVIDLEVRAANELGEHATGSVQLSLPLR